jgi:alanine racemase
MPEPTPVAIRPTIAQIDLGAIRQNLKLVRQLAPGCAICAIVKANAYGHGLIPVAKTLAKAGRVDVTDVPGAYVEDEVVLMGRQQGDEISASELARWAHTIPYEIIGCVGARVPRRYLGERF